MTEWAQQAFDAHPDLGFLAHVLGLAQYRAGQNEAAIKNLQKATGLGWPGEVLDWLVQATIHDRLGRSVETQQCVAKTRELMKIAQPSAADGETWFPCPDWIEFNVLSREAEKLLRPAPGQGSVAAPPKNAVEGSENKQGK